MEAGMRRSCRSRWPFGALLVWAVATAAPQDFALLDDECEATSACARHSSAVYGRTKRA